MNVELRLFLSNLIRSWYIVVAMMLIGLAVAGAHFAATEPAYSSSARLQVVARSTADVNNAAQAQTLAVQLAVTYAQLAGTDLVLAPAAKRSGEDVTVTDLAASVTSVATDSTPFITVTATAGSAAGAARIAEAVAQELIVATNSGSGGSSALSLREVQPAGTPATPITGSLQSELPLGAAIGLILGIVVVLLRDRFDTRFRGLGGVQAATGVDVLGTLPADPRGRNVPAVSMAERSSERYEAFRSLRTALSGQGLLPEGGSVLAVSSAVVEEGRTSVVAGLAVAIAASGREVVVVDADLRRARVARVLGVEPGPGLAEVLAGTATVESVLQDVPQTERVRLLRAGSAGPGSGELFESQEYATLLTELRGEATVVLVDSPPLLAVADAAAIARHSDHVLLVVGAPVVKEREVQSALAVLHQVQIMVAGIVVNRMPRVWADSGVSGYRSASNDARGSR
jgi:succinoglycan biosynthesis transport protein ExoP